MYHELSLIVCFTRIAINVPRIVINCFGVLYQSADGYSSHVMPTQACALAGIYGCDIQESAYLNIKPDIAYRGVVGPSSHVMPTLACAMAGIYGCGLSLSSVLL